MDETPETGSSTERSSVVKALRLLADVAGSREPVALAELSRRLKLPKPTAYRLARALEGFGFIQKDPLTRRYVVGSGLEEVALNALKHGAGHRARRLLMNELAERLGARVNLVILKSGNLSFVEWVESTAPLRVDIRGDLPMPIHCSASGKLLLAFGSPALRDGVMRSAPFRAHTKHTITTAKELERELARICRRGHSEDNQELLPGVNCLAVPIHNRAGDVVAGLAIMAPSASLPLEEMRRRLPEIRACAERISADLRAPAAAAGNGAEPPARQVARRTVGSRATGR
ncbi:MAG: IclR family transcriptional regulator [Hyphomicrobiaceae bacterium]|nr:IclR family transcriptional regulator [Hyphomicrobiaceae bacterium]